MVDLYHLCEFILLYHMALDYTLHFVLSLDSFIGGCLGV